MYFLKKAFKLPQNSPASSIVVVSFFKGFFPLKGIPIKKHEQQLQSKGETNSLESNDSILSQVLKRSSHRSERKVVVLLRSDSKGDRARDRDAYPFLRPWLKDSYPF